MALQGYDPGHLIGQFAERITQLLSSPDASRSMQAKNGPLVGQVVCPISHIQPHPRIQSPPSRSIRLVA